MTLEYFSDYQELFNKCVLWFTGRNSSILGFPILPNASVVTPSGTFGSYSLGDNKTLITFTGSEYITVSDHNNYTIGSNDFTYCFWVRFSDVSTSRSLFIHYNSTSNFISHIPFTTSTMLEYACKLSGTYVVDMYNASAAISKNTWYFVAITRTGSSYTMYLNNVSRATYTYAGSLSNISGSLYFGWNNAGSTYYHRGQLKDFMFFNGRMLSTVEMALLMKLTNPANGYDIQPILPGIRGVE